MLGIGPVELVIILVIVLVIFGAGKLPQIGEALGKGIRNFKKATEDKHEHEPLEISAPAVKTTENKSLPGHEKQPA